MACIVLICKELLVDLIPILQLHFQNWLWASSRWSRLWTNIIEDIRYLLFLLSSQKEESVCGVKHEQDYPLQP